MDVSYQLSPVNFPSESSPLPSPGIELTLIGDVTGSNQRLYPLCHKWLSSTFQPPEEGLSVQRPKCCDKHGDKDQVWFGLVWFLCFNGISTLCRLFNAKAILVERTVVVLFNP